MVQKPTDIAVNGGIDMPDQSIIFLYGEDVEGVAPSIAYFRTTLGVSSIDELTGIKAYECPTFQINSGEDTYSLLRGHAEFQMRAIGPISAVRPRSGYRMTAHHMRRCVTAFVQITLPTLVQLQSLPHSTKGNLGGRASSISVSEGE